MKEIRICLECKIPYIAKRNKQKYCSLRCANQVNGRITAAKKIILYPLHHFAKIFLRQKEINKNTVL